MIKAQILGYHEEMRNENGIQNIKGKLKMLCLKINQRALDLLASLRRLL